ncbi:Modification methylase BspRI [Pseudovibrio axinellae]|uniref:DNA (cytosine-5-)-methyltransferase n=1 Tax=Pseudovibrio axinellae TaxID=989403 RepID=A0A165XF67_9HYPH|nr:DNA cytosine methyltransferase [Pseudovibrio axinellae]KZL17650.1 Modification methylase BspRI [Pseudovibrio axinellae]SER44962.1 DNA (cytosine-5)-methyltransferase 1 [Pseudovibrio axinellae]
MQDLFQFESFQSPVYPHEELIIDAFAGGGGASTGIEQALGRSPDIAINHCDKALAMHAQNHPDTIHLTESVWDVDLKTHTNGRPVGLLWASPDCRHFSRAGGKRILSPEVRMLAWSIVHFCQKLKAKRPRVIMVENVVEFKGWGPLDDEGNQIKSRAGETFEQWCEALRKLGYKLEVRVLRASDYGAPTIRKRLFIIARRDGKPIVWPAPTHGDPNKAEFVGSGLRPWRTAAECIDWSIPCKSIFNRKKPLVPKTMKRIAAGIQKFVIDAQEPFILNMSHGGRLEPLRRPMTTIKTEKGGCRALVIPCVDRQYGNSKCADITDPLGTVTAGGGGGSALVAAFLHKYYGQKRDGEIRGHLPDSPLHTLTTARRYGLVTSHLTMMRGSCKHGRSVDQPMPTNTAGGNHIAEVRSFLTAYYGTSVGQKLSRPIGTTTTKDRFGLVSVEISGEPYVITDIGMRMLTSRELYRANGYPEGHIIDFEHNGKPFSKEEQVAKCGNGVPPPWAKALSQANCPEMIVRAEAA